MLPMAWLPEANLSERQKQDKVPYEQWVRDGHLHTTPGQAISKLHVLQRMLSICEVLDVQGVAYDRWRIADLKSLAADNSIELPPLVDFGQGFNSMSPAIEQFETLLLNGELCHPNNPVMTWAASNAVIVEDDAGNRKLSKRRATGRIDLIVAAVMAVGIAAKAEPGLDLDAMLADPLST